MSAWLFMATLLLLAPPGGARLIEQAHQAREANRLDEAARLYGRVVQLHPKETEAWWYLGTIRYEQDRHAEAAQAMARVVALKPDGGPGWVMLGLAQYRAGQHEKALAALVRGRALGVGDNPSLDTVSRYHHALLASKAGQFELALQLLADFARQGNEGPQALEASGIAALRLPKLPAELTPEERPLVMQAGRAAWLANARRVTEGRQVAEALAAEHPRVPHVHYLLGNLLLQEQAPRALEAFRQEIALQPQHVPSRLQVAYELLNRGDAAAALPYAAAAAKLDSQSFATRNIHGRVLLALGRVEEAVPELEMAVTLAPDSPETHFHLAAGYAKAGKAAEAARERAVFQKLRGLRETQRP